MQKLLLISAGLLSACAKEKEKVLYIPTPQETTEALKGWLSAKDKAQTEMTLIQWVRTPEGARIFERAVADLVEAGGVQGRQAQARRKELLNSEEGFSLADRKKLDEQEARAKSDAEALGQLRRRILGR